MPVLLDIAPEKVATYVAAGAGAIAGIAKALGALRDLRKRREYAREAEAAEQDAQSRAHPFGVPADPSMALAESRAREERLRADLFEATWRLSDVSRQLLVTSQENARLKQAVRSARLDAEGAAITCGHLRARVRDLEYQLGEALVVEVPDSDPPTTPLVVKA